MSKFLTIFLSLSTAISLAAQILNGGFETPSTKKSTRYFIQLAEHWEGILHTGVDLVKVELSPEAYSGKKSFKLNTIKEKSFAGVYQTIKCQPDSELTLTAYMKRGKNPCNGYFRIYFIKNKIKQKTYLMAGWPLKEQWNLYQYNFRVPKDIHEIYLGIETLGNRHPDCQVWIDEVALSSKSAPILQNQLIRAEIDPMFGGCIRSLEYTKNNQTTQFTLPRSMNETGGIGLEIIPEQRSPGLFANKTYLLEIIKPKEKILVTRTENNGEFTGLQVKKTYTLNPGSATINVNLELINHSKKSLPLSLRICNILRSTDGYFTSPTRDWLQIFHKNQESIQTSNSLDSNNLQAGWLAKTNPSSAMLFGFQLDKVKNGYSWFNPEIETLEWTYLPQNIAPGKSWNSSYTINILASPSPVFAFDGQVGYGVNNLNTNQAKHVEISALKQISTDVKVNKQSSHLQLNAGGTARIPFAVENIELSIFNDNHYFGSAHRYPAHFIRGIKLPPPPQIDGSDRFSGVFPFCYFDTALVWEESSGIKAGTAQQFLRQLNHIMRECAANYFNTCTLGRVNQPAILKCANLPDGKNSVGELAIKYDQHLVFNTHLYFKDSLDPIKHQSEIKRLLDFFYGKIQIDFIKKYDSIIKGINTADETTGQNIPCMLAAHEALAQRLPVKIPAYPYLNVHTRSYLPYVPIFDGDWFPINRKNFGGRNPWSAGRVVAETVAMAKNTPVFFEPQCFGYFKEGYAFPTPAEIRLMSHLPVANGAKGIFFHEVNNRGLPWRYNYGYAYTARGNAGELTPAWFALGECARELTSIGTQVLDSSPCPVPSWLKINSPIYKSKNGFYHGEQVKFYTLKKADNSLIAVAINHSEKSDITLPIIFTPPAGIEIYSLSKMKPVNNKHTLKLNAGDAEYFAIGNNDTIKKIANSVALERHKRELIVCKIIMERAAGNNVKLSDLQILINKSIISAKNSLGHDALNLLKTAKAEIYRRYNNSEFGKFDAEWRKTRMALSEISFLFQTHLDLVIPPHLRAKTPKHKKWNNTDDPQMQKLVDEIAACWYEYWRLEHEIVTGKWSVIRLEAEKLCSQANLATANASSYIKANAHKITPDRPYDE